MNTQEDSELSFLKSGFLLQKIFDKAFRKARLRTVLIVPFIVQICAAVGLTGWLSIRNGQRAVNDVMTQLSHSVTDRIDQHVRDYLNTPHLFHQINAAAIRNGSLNLEDFDALALEFWSQIQLNEAVDYIFFGNENGDFVGVQNLPEGKTVLKIRDAFTVEKREIYQLDDGGNPIEFLGSKPYDPRNRPWYEAAKKEGKPTWSSIYSSAHLGVLQITPVVPIENPDGTFRGALGTNLILSQIGHFLAKLDISPSGDAFIIERSGALVASSTPEQYAIETEAGEDRLQAQESLTPVIAQTVKHLIKTFGDLNGIQQTQQVSYSLDGDRQLVQVTPFRDGRGLDWLVVVVIPEADFMGQIHANTRNTIWLCLAALVLAMGVGILKVRWVVRPIARLNSSAKAIAKGQWEKVDANSRSPLLDRADEVGELAQSFNSMAHQLQESFERLETQNQELQRLDQLKDEFLANTSHELRTPLNATIGIVESMLDGATGSLSPLQQQNLLMVAQSGHRLAKLIDDILDFSKLRHQTLELQLKPIGLREIVEVVFAFSQTLVGKKELQLINAISPQLPLVRADENRLQQILYNLVGNAIKFTDRGFVGISVEFKKGDPVQVASMLAITVADTGIGIPEDKLDQIFESFEQGDGSTARAYGGTGLGLAVTKKLVELHGGEISVRSSFGSGSQFTFTLPISSEKVRVKKTEKSLPVLNFPSLTLNRQLLSHQVEQKPAKQNVNEPDRFKVLIVDDEPVNLQVLLNHLSRENYAVTQAANGLEALSIVERGYRPDLILLDVMMPKMTGYEVCRQLRETFSSNELPIVMLTAKNQVSDLVTALDVGANDYLTKPIRKPELLARIKTHLKLATVYIAYDRFVPHQFLNFLNKESIVDVKLGDEVQKNMSILFSDIRDFTALSEGIGPEESFKFINAYLSRMEPAILENNGFIDKYIGDAIMALFGESADDAVKAGIAMQQQLMTYNQYRFQHDLEPIRIGIGINTGDLMLGTVGGKKRMDGTVISDAVNLASRLEGVTKNYGVSLVISDRTFMALERPEAYHIRIIDRVKVKGKSEKVSVFEVFDADPPELRERKSATKTAFEQALVFYHMESFQEAAKRLEVCLNKNPGDTVIGIYLERCQTQFHKTREYSRTQAN